VSARRQLAFEYFVQMGWTREQSAGIVANLEAESGLRHDAVGDGGAAYGIAQWHPPRQSGFAGLFGKPIQGSSFEDQLYFVHAELRGAEKAAGTALAACTTASEAGACVSARYERPADREGEADKRAMLAERIAQEYASAPILVPPTPIPPDAPKPPYTPVLPALPPQPENPMLPAFLLQLLPMITGGFSQAGQAQLQPITSRPADQIAPFLLNLFSQVAGATGVLPQGQQITTNEQAVAAAAEFSKLKGTNAALVAQIEAKSLAYLADMAPLFDRMAAADAAENAARLAGRQSASSVAIEEHKAGLWDMTQTLVTSLLIMLWGIAWGLLGGILGLAFKTDKPDPTLLAALIGLAGPIWTGAIVATVVAVVAYRFDGSSATNAARAIQGTLDVASKRVQ